MDLSQTFFRYTLTREKQIERKHSFMLQFIHLTSKELVELAWLYDMFEVLYAQAPPRKAKPGSEPDEHFAHLYRCMLIPIFVCKLKPSLEGTKLRGAHDLKEEVLEKPTADTTLKILVGAKCAEDVDKLSIPGKYPGNKATLAMKELYYEVIKASQDFEVQLSFGVDHLDCLWDIEGLSIPSCKQKIWEIENICLPVSCAVIAKTEPRAARLLIREFERQLKRIRILSPYAGNV